MESCRNILRQGFYMDSTCMETGSHQYRNSASSLPWRRPPSGQRWDRLEKQGYIKVDARKGSEVIYQASPAKFRENAARYFGVRREGIADLFQSAELLFEPLWETRIIMSNGLAQNLYWEVIRYLRFPYLMDIEKQRVICENLKKRSVSDIIAYLRNEFESAYRPAAEEILTFIEEACKEYPLDEEEPIPFWWSIYRQRPQIRYTLVSDIIRDVIRGRYPQGSYLPSLPRLADQYQVSVNTIRRALDILEGLGVASSLQGKGTLVRKEPGKSIWRRRKYRRECVCSRTAWNCWKPRSGRYPSIRLKRQGAEKEKDWQRGWRGWSEKKLVMYVLRRICRL